MNLTPKVSCTCITHNRVAMFRRSMQCFHDQIYKNRELVVLFENDPATEAFVAGNSDYTYAELHEEENLPPAYTITVIDGDILDLQAGQKLFIRNPEGLYLDTHNRKWHFTYEDTEGLELEADTFSDGVFTLKAHGLWVNIQIDGTIELTDQRAKAAVYGYTTQLDTTVTLEFGGSPHPQDSIERIGWRKKIIRQGKIDNVVFYNIFPQRKLTLGMKRNLSIKAAQGEFICVWDDDDWHAEHRIHNQMNFLQFTGKPACSLAYTILYDHNTDYAYHNLERATGHENTLLFRKEGAGQYGNKNVEEDTPMLVSFYNRNLLSVMEDPELYIYNYHKRNTCSPSHFKMVIGRSILLDTSYAGKVKEVLAFPGIEI